MPHGWLSRGRWPGWPSAWRRSRRARWRLRFARAVADGDRIDWQAVVKRASGEDRSFVVGLRRLAALRNPSRPPDPVVIAPRWTLAVMTAVALAQIIGAWLLGAVSLASANGWPPALDRPAGLMAAFSLTCLALGPAALRDSRALLLVMIFALSASAFAQPVLAVLDQAHDGAIGPLYRGLHPDIFACAALWQFAAVFPQVRHSGRLEMAARHGTSVALALAALVFCLNLVDPWRPGAQPVWMLNRNHPDYLFWRLFAACSLPALLLVLFRAAGAAAAERRKIVRLAGVLAIAVGPFLLAGVARFVPAVDRWMRESAGGSGTELLIVLPLAVLPILVSVAVLVDTPFISPGTVEPARRPLWGALPTWIGRRFLARRLRDRLPASLDQIRRTRGSRELTVVLERELRRALRGAPIEVFDPAGLPAGSAITTLLRNAALPLDVALDREPFVWLPRSDREWLERRDVRLAGAIRRRDGTIAAIVLAGPPPGAREFDRTARWFMQTLLIGASPAWPAAAEAHGDQEPAYECVQCGAVSDPGRPPCCSSPLVLSALPRKLAGHYRVERRIGSGGMGVVYRAHDEALGRDVALKTLPGLQDVAAERLRDEARAMAALSHPGIATIFGLEFWRGTPVLAVEYCDSTLAERLAAGPLDPDAAIELGIGLCDALHHLHGRGLAHRDVKPRNIGLTADGDAKLLDFGIAALPDPAAGTVAYLPPEAFEGAAPGPAFDLWALGVVLAEAAAGGDHRLRRVLRRATAVRPADRFASAAEMGEALAGLRRRR